MEKYTSTHYLMCKLKSNFPYSSMNSFISPGEEQKPVLFQEEPFGGFTWPPRFYTCSFCRREFRSAQALGGHMNVHRRDRARLKQSSPPQQAQSEILHHHQKQTSDSYQEPVMFPAQIIVTPLDKEVGEPFMNRRRSEKQGLRDDDECNDYDDFVETKLSMGINLVDGGDIICKRHKKSSSVSSSLPFLPSKLCSSDRCGNSSSMEDIDLELRLGNPPAVK